jgi:hypothetical protein
MRALGVQGATTILGVVLAALAASTIAACGSGTSTPAATAESVAGPAAATSATSTPAETAGDDRSALLRVGDTAHLVQGDRAADVTVLSATKTADGTTVRFRVINRGVALDDSLLLLSGFKDPDGSGIGPTFPADDTTTIAAGETVEREYPYPAGDRHLFSVQLDSTVLEPGGAARWDVR